MVVLYQKLLLVRYRITLVLASSRASRTLIRFCSCGRLLVRRIPLDTRDLTIVQ